MHGEGGCVWHRGAGMAKGGIHGQGDMHGMGMHGMVKGACMAKGA